MNAIGADHQVCAGVAAIDEIETDLIALLIEADQLPVEVDEIGGHC